MPYVDVKLSYDENKVNYAQQKLQTLAERDSNSKIKQSDFGRMIILVG